MKRKINLRLIGITVLAMIWTVIAITFVYYGLFQKQVRADLVTSANLLKDTGYFDSTEIDLKSIDLSTDRNDLRVTWIDGDGSVLYDNDISAGQLANHKERPEINEAFQEGQGESVRTSDTMNENTFYYALRLDNGTVLRVAVNARSLLAVFLSVMPLIILILIVIILICLVLSRMLTRQILDPVEAMADNLENAEYDAPYPELEPLSERLKSQHADVLAAAKARQDFTANVSHELKTPLTAISGYADLLQAGMVAEDKKNHLYEEIRKNSNRLLSLINDIIQLSEFDQKGKKIAFEEVDLYQVVLDCMDELMVNARQKGISLTLEGRPCYINANREMMRELIENLAQNAIRYNNKGGSVGIRVEKEDGDALLVVKDNGIGIPKADQKRIFERFYRVDKSRSKATGGSGLGLSIVKHIVELHQAKISIESSPGEGTTMTVVF